MIKQSGVSPTLGLENGRILLRIPMEIEARLFCKWMGNSATNRFLNSEDPLLLEEKLERLYKDFAILPQGNVVQVPSLSIKMLKPPERSLQQRFPREIVFAMVEKESCRCIGAMALQHISNVSKTAYTRTVIGRPEFQGKGFSREAKMLLLQYAFETLELEKICSNSIESNLRSYNYNQACGYKVEAVLKSHAVVDAKRHDLVCMAIFKKDWPEALTQYQLDVTRRKEKAGKI